MDSQVIELLIGAILPPFIDVINTRLDSPLWRYIVSLTVCLLVGLALSWNNLNLNDILNSGAIVFAAAQTIYKTYWKESAVREKVFDTNR